MSSCIYFNLYLLYLYYLTRNTKHPSLWEGSGIKATDEQQKEIPPITAEETATGASEGQVVETIYAAISLDTQLLLGPTPQPTPAPVEQTGTSATTQSGGAQTTQAATNTQAAATQAAATQPAQTTQAATQAAATQAAATQAAATQAAATTGATEVQTTTTAGKYFSLLYVCILFSALFSLFDDGALTLMIPLLMTTKNHATATTTTTTTTTGSTTGATTTPESEGTTTTTTVPPDDIRNIAPVESTVGGATITLVRV